MDYSQAFAISVSGMAVETLRVETVAMNLANVYSARGAGGGLYQPQRVLSGPAVRFGDVMDAFRNTLAGVEVYEIASMNANDRMVYEPGHPAADSAGFVAYPGIEPVGEMIGLIEALRAYDANVMAFNAAKTMALRALEIGGGR